MGGTTHFTDFADTCAHQHAAVGDEHDVVVAMHQGGSHDFAVALGLLDGDHALGAASVAGVFIDRCAFAVAVFSGGQHTGAGHVRSCAAVGQGGHVLRGHQHGNHALAIFNHHPTHTTGAATQGTHIVFVKAHCFATVREQHHIVLAVS